MLPELNDWLSRVCKNEKPPERIIAFNIGLFETSDGFCAYLIGSEKFEDSDDDWACEEAFSPSERYCPIEANGKEWEEFQTRAVATVAKFTSSEIGKSSFLAKAKH
jgi:hypothetical protein